MITVQITTEMLTHLGMKPEGGMIDEVTVVITDNCSQAVAVFTPYPTQTVYPPAVVVHVDPPLIDKILLCVLVQHYSDGRGDLMDDLLGRLLRGS